MVVVLVVVVAGGGGGVASGAAAVVSGLYKGLGPFGFRRFRFQGLGLQAVGLGGCWCCQGLGYGWGLEVQGFVFRHCLQATSSFSSFRTMQSCI